MRRQFYEGNNVFNTVKEQKIRIDNINEERRVAVYKYVHSPNVT